MTKAILVIDMPEGCTECNCAIDLCHGTIPSQEWYKKRPSWCPLRPMPEQMSWGHATDYIYGWNDCLDEITGETDDR